METDLDMPQMIKLVDKDIKTAIITMLHMFKKAEEGVSMLRREKVFFFKKKTQVELLKMKNTIAEMKIQNYYGNYNFCHYFLSLLTPQM